MSQATSVASLRPLVNNNRNTRSFIPKCAGLFALREEILALMKRFRKKQW